MTYPSATVLHSQVKATMNGDAMTDTYTQGGLWDDPAVAAEERELFGDRVRPMRPALDAEGDFIVGFVISLERDVDLKTGFAPADILTFEATSGALAGRTERARKGQPYAWAVLHATARNQLAAIDPEPSKGERIAIRRGRTFVSNQEGPSYGKELVGWDIVMPDRIQDTTPDTNTKRGK